MEKLGKRKTEMISMSVGIIGLLCLVIGIFRGEAGTVMEKAIRICLECVGIG